MSDGAAGANGGAGQQGGGQGAGTAGGAGAGTPPPAAANSGGAPDWLSGFTDEGKGYVQNKGWKTPVEAIESYKSLEKFHGVPPEQLVKLPKDDNPEAWNEVFKKIGRPENADGYKLAMPEKSDPEFAKWAKSAFHESGLTTKQAEKLASKWNEHVNGTLKSMSEQKAAQVTQESDGLKKEWGAAYDQNVNVAKRAAASFGIDAATIDKLEDAMGYAGVIKFMHGLGAKTGEASFVTGDSRQTGFQGGGALTPGQAKARITELRSDPGFVAKYVANDASAKAEMQRLHEFAYNQES